MVNHFKKVAVTLGLLALAGCGGGMKSSSVPAAKPPSRVEAKFDGPTSGLIETARWKLTLPSEISVVRSPATGTGATYELLAKSTVRHGAGPVIVMLVSTQTVMDPTDFIEQLVTGLQETGRVRVIKGAMGEVSGYPAAFMLTIRLTEGGHMIGGAEVVTSTGKMGYDLLCAGDVDAADEFGDMCSAVVQSFALKQ